MPTVAERTARSRAGWCTAGSFEPAGSPRAPELLSRVGIEVYELGGASAVAHRRLRVLEAATGFPQSMFWMIWMSSSVR
jgi:hypothetical protein